MNRSVPVTRAACIAAAVALAGCATQGQVSLVQPVAAVNNDGGLAIKGYDAVGYFADSRPEPGSPAITSQWQGATYRFTSEEHRAAFVASPGHYAPQYGGFCAFAISRGRIAPIQPDHWAVYNDRLYLNNNLAAQQLWSLDRSGNVKAGDANWPLVPKRPLTSG